MKITLSVMALLATLSASAFARDYYYVSEKKLPLALCRAQIRAFAFGHNFDLKEWKANDFYVMRGENLEGNAYYSDGTCYIYLHH